LLAEPGSIRVVRADTDDLGGDDDTMTVGSSASDAADPRGEFESREVADGHSEGYGDDATATVDSNASDAADSCGSFRDNVDDIWDPGAWVGLDSGVVGIKLRRILEGRPDLLD
jgi:hypothetical protein